MKEVIKIIYYIYIHRNKVNNKIYIGQTCQQPPSKRWYPSSYKNNPHFYVAIQKYGWDNFEHSIIESVYSLEEANEKEKYWIQYYNSTNIEFGYNIRPGGDNAPIAEETRKKMSLNHRDVKGEKNYFYGKHFCGKEHHFYGKHHSEESKRKISEKLINKNGKPVICISTGEIFNTASEGGRQKDVSGSHIIECCKGKRKSAGKDKITKEPLIWKYYIDEE